MREEEAIEFAKSIALKEGWTWLTPVSAKQKPTKPGSSPLWEVLSNAGAIGSNVRIVFEEQSGQIIEKRFLPR